MAAIIDKDNGVGLERLQYLASVRIHQKINWGGGSNKYKVKTVNGEVVFTMTESDGGLIELPASTRGFDMEAMDCEGTKAFMIRRPTMCTSDKVVVTMDGQVVSIVREDCSTMKHIFRINDGNDVPVYRVKGEYALYNFQLQYLDKTALGSISKKFGGVMREMFTSADDYDITFPADLELRYKVATIATCILIDYKHHEG